MIQVGRGHRTIRIIFYPFSHDMGRDRAGHLHRPTTHQMQEVQISNSPTRSGASVRQYSASTENVQARADR
ncbi:unnamed protein product [Ixodes persulcatus]